MSDINGNGNGNGVGDQPQSRFYQRRGTGGYYCEECRNRIPHRVCRPKRNPNVVVQPAKTQWKLPYKGFDFPRRSMPITPQEELFDETRILGGRETCITRTPTGETVLRQLRVETTKIIETSGFDPSVYRILDPLLEKLEHLYPRHDAEPVYTGESAVDVGPTPPGSPRPTFVPALTMDTPVANDTILRWISLRPLDGLVPSQVGVSITVDGNPVKAIATPLAATSPPTYGVQPQTSEFVDAVGVPSGYYNLLLNVAERKRIIINVANFDPIATRKIAVAAWGWLQPMTDFNR